MHRNLVFVSEGLGQCVENAECSDPNGGLCLCKQGFYKDADQCRSKLGPGQRCERNEQCVDNAQCNDSLTGNDSLTCS